MKTPAITLTTLALFATSATLALAENAYKIASGFETQKIEALEAYLAENPEAEDKDLAYSILIDANQNLGKQEALPDLIEKRYALLEKGAEANLQLIATEIAQPFVQASIVSGQRDRAKAFLTKIKADLEPHPQGQQFAQFLDNVGKELYLPGVGDSMEIAFTSMKGEDIDLTEMKDKVILVDFWATWCGPCVAEMPNVVAAHEKYKEQGFEVIGISLDENKEAVETFVTENGLNWPQYFDGKGWGNEIAQRFGISSIPATFLVGKDGKIVASNLRGPDLENAIEKALE
ncbi:MAG: TlpA disulfide reductase family protein [Verrucomicrobiales bacterium]|jgi:thiol-disulfide isomerase/thioredoxin|nr:TlpA disulfide reductase family protein [Verrucomicrobiales bacterium]